MYKIKHTKILLYCKTDTNKRLKKKYIIKTNTSYTFKKKKSITQEKV